MKNGEEVIWSPSSGTATQSGAGSTPQLAELIETERSYLYSLRELESRILTPIRQDPERVGMQAEEIKRLVNQFPEIIGLGQPA
jgi:hypothetical protein